MEGGGREVYREVKRRDKKGSTIANKMYFQILKQNTVLFLIQVPP